jgi:hypothetical protein
MSLSLEAGEQIVATRIQEDKIKMAFGLIHFIYDVPGIDSLELDVIFSYHVCINRDQIILAFHLHAMPGLIEQPYTTTLGPFTKLKDGIRQSVGRRIRVENHLELRCCEHLGNVLSVVGGIRQRGRVLIRRISNY